MHNTHTHTLTHSQYVPNYDAGVEVVIIAVAAAVAIVKEEDVNGASAYLQTVRSTVPYPTR
jgi:hypothetical protein